MTRRYFGAAQALPPLDVFDDAASAPLSLVIALTLSGRGSAPEFKPFAFADLAAESHERSAFAVSVDALGTAVRALLMLWPWLALSAAAG